ncbi:MAG: hypothetical protein F6K31_25255 [Symploca sp. SIO2G7]|nr:hypothetical protein [Symploca sp. SIO2G7]
MKPAPMFGILGAALPLLHFVAATLAAPHPGDYVDTTIRQSSDPTVPELTRQFAAALRHRRQQWHVTQQDRQWYDHYAAQQPPAQPYHQDQMIAYQYLQEQCGSQGQPTQMQLRQAARILFQGPLARQLRQQESRTAAVDYVKQQVNAVMQQRMHTRQQQRYVGVDMER